jgi:Tc5 transposase DNA-binding domain
MSTNETRLSDAIKQWERGIFTTKRQCAAICAVSYNLLVARLSGRKSRCERKPVNKRLTPQEENAILAFMLRLDTAGIQGNVRTIETCANTLIKSRITGPLESPPQPLGSKWATRFLETYTHICD